MQACVDIVSRMVRVVWHSMEWQRRNDSAYWIVPMVFSVKFGTVPNCVQCFLQPFPELIPRESVLVVERRPEENTM